MTTTYLSRAAWTDEGPARAMEALDPDRVVGFAIHWPGSTASIGNPSASSVANRLEGYRRFHVDDRGWSDIAYQVAIDAAGRVWDCRGIKWRSAGNGSDSGNDTYGAVLLMLGPGDVPSDAMVQAIRDWRTDRWLVRYPRATKVVGHHDIRPEPTACPGDPAEQLVTSGAITKGTTMALTDGDVTKVATKTVAGLDVVPAEDYRKPKAGGGFEPINPSNPTTTVKGALAALYRRTWEILHTAQETQRQQTLVSARVEAVERQLGQLLAVGVNVDAITDRLAPAVADAVAQELSGRLAEDNPPEASQS